MLGVQNISRRRADELLKILNKTTCLPACKHSLKGVELSKRCAVLQPCKHSCTTMGGFNVTVCCCLTTAFVGQSASYTSASPEKLKQLLLLHTSDEGLL